MAAVTLTGVRKIYPAPRGGAPRTAVDGIDLAVADGEFLVLLGPSGCGKSTTLRMIAGLESVSAGTLAIGDRVVNDVPAKARNVAMVFQNYALYPHMTAFDNIAFNLKLRGVPGPEIDARVREAAAVLGIDALLQRRPRQLSGGEQQRVALGRALVRRPEVFLFDEPLSNLDAKLRVQMRREIARLHRHLGTTMIYVTHDQAEAMTLGDRIAVMHAGRILQADRPMAVYRAPRNTFVAGFLGSPPMNLIPGVVAPGPAPRFRADRGGIEVAPADEGRAALAAGAGRPVICGIRPEHLAPAAAGAPGAVPLRVDLVEPLGQEVLVYASADGQEVTARLAPEAAEGLAVGETRAFTVDPRAVTFFDAVSGDRLPGGPAAIS